MASEVQSELGGTWKLDRSEDFDAFLVKKGVGMIMKKMATTLKPSLNITLSGETFTFTISFGPKTNIETFKLGEEYKPGAEADAEKATSTWESASKTLTTEMTAKDPKKPKTIIKRSIVNGELVQAMSYDGVECKRIFKKQT